MGCPDNANANHSATRPFAICAARHFDSSREMQDVQLRIKQHTISFRTHYNEAIYSQCVWIGTERSGAVVPNSGALMAAY